VIAFKYLKSCKFPNTGQSPAELNQAGGKAYCSDIFQYHRVQLSTVLAFPVCCCHLHYWRCCIKHHALMPMMEWIDPLILNLSSRWR